MKNHCLETLVKKVIAEEKNNNLITVNSNDKIVYFVDPKACSSFLKKYPLVKLAMLKFIKLPGTTMSKYKKFLSFKDKNEDKLGGRPKTIKSPNFGEKTFYKYDFPTTKSGSMGFAEVFQYLVLNS